MQFFRYKEVHNIFTKLKRDSVRELEGEDVMPSREKI